MNLDNKKRKVIKFADWAKSTKEPDQGKPLDVSGQYQDPFLRAKEQELQKVADKADSMKEQAREEPLDVSDLFLNKFLDKKRRKMKQFADQALENIDTTPAVDRESRQTHSQSSSEASLQDSPIEQPTYLTLVSQEAPVPEYSTSPSALRPI